MSYSISDFGRMLADEVRMEPYARALAAAIEPGSVVLDIGSGTGVFALMACRLGARKVYAVEPGDAILIAEKSARSNGYADRVETIQDFSTEITLPERADIIVSDLRGVVPLLGHHIPAIIDARERHLAPNGVLIPQADTIMVAVVSAPEAYDRAVGAFRSHSRGFDMEAERAVAANSWYVPRPAPKDLLTAGMPWAEIDYTTIDATNARTSLTYSASTAGTAHGLSLWFQATLAPGIRYSTAPTEPATVYRNGFLPFLEPVTLAVGDVILVDLAANLVGNHYIWRWNTTVRSRGEGEAIKAEFRQSTFFGSPLSPARLRKRSPGHRATLGPKGLATRDALELMSGELSNQELADQLFDKYRETFREPADALELIGKLAETYGP